MAPTNGEMQTSHIAEVQRTGGAPLWRPTMHRGTHLWEGEAVDQMTTGTYGNGNGLVVLTDRRLL